MYKKLSDNVQDAPLLECVNNNSSVSCNYSSSINVNWIRNTADTSFNFEGNPAGNMVSGVYVIFDNQDSDGNPYSDEVLFYLATLIFFNRYNKPAYTAMRLNNTFYYYSAYGTINSSFLVPTVPGGQDNQQIDLNSISNFPVTSDMLNVEGVNRGYGVPYLSVYNTADDYAWMYVSGLTNTGQQIDFQLSPSTALFNVGNTVAYSIENLNFYSDCNGVECDTQGYSPAGYLTPSCAIKFIGNSEPEGSYCLRDNGTQFQQYFWNFSNYDTGAVTSVLTPCSSILRESYTQTNPPPPKNNQMSWIWIVVISCVLLAILIASIIYATKTSI